MSWYRDYSDMRGSDDAALEGGGGGSLSIAYDIEGYSPAQILSNPTAVLGGESGSEPLPGYGSELEEFPGFFLDRYDCSGNGRVCKVIGVYTRNGGGRIPPRPAPPQIGSAIFRASPFEIEFDVPYELRVRQLFPQPPGFSGPPFPGDPPGFYSQLIWKHKDSSGNRLVRRWTQTMTKFTTTATIARENFVGAAAAIKANNNKLHQINNRLFQFIGGDLNPTSDGLFYTTDLTWWADDGWSFPSIYWNGYANVNAPTPQLGTLPIVGPPQTRPPFHELVIVERTDGDITLPSTFAALPIEDLNLGGHLVLAGYVEGWT